MEVILNINDLNYKEIFKKISLSIEKGKIITISGSNNSGKTTLARILDRKIRDSFNINYKGKDILDYKLEDYCKGIQVVFPREFHFVQKTVQEEIESKNLLKEKESFYKKELKYFKLWEKKIDKLSIQEKILLQIILAMAKANDLIVIDNLDYYLNKKELEEVYSLAKRETQKFKTSILFFTTSLEQALKTDELYILYDGEIILHGEPLTILQKDNVLNKIGLTVPFMIDLCVKLRDYELIKDIELDKERLIDILWN